MRCNLFSLVGPLSLFVFSLTSVGCSTIHYQITLKPDGDAIERTLVCWVTSKSKPFTVQKFPGERLAAVAAAYHVEPQKKLDQKHTFSGRFIGKMPNDIGNSGTFTRWVSPFGTGSIYLERLGGSDDITAQIKSWEGAANRTIDLIIGWLDSELGSDRNWKGLRTAIDTKVRHDFVNLANIVLVAGGTLNPFDTRRLDESSPAYQQWVSNDLGSVALRLFQYLVEHGYLDVSDITSFARYSSGKDDEVKALFKRHAERLLRQLLKMTDSETIPSSLAFLTNFESMGPSLERYLLSRPEHEVLVARKKKESEENATVNSDEVFKAIVMNDDQLLADMFQSFQLFVDGQRISVDLSCPVRPVMTNGTWNEQSKSIQWKTDQQGSLGMPALAEAIWAEPNSEEQTQRFGEVILEGAKLGAYTVWYAGLSKDEAKEWDAFVATWQPGPKLIRSIELFRFSFDPPSKKERVFALDLSGGEIASTAQRETSPSLADVPRGILVEALKKQRDADK
jgi:hypothetical protein